MKIFQNIPGAFTILFSLPGLTHHRKMIDAARASGDLLGEREHILAASQKWGKYLIKHFGVELTVYGKENLPPVGPVVFVCNHQGFADIPVLCASLDNFQFGFIAKDNLKQVPLYGVWMRRIRSVMIKRDDPRASLQAISEGIDLINQGFSMTVFPEGTRSKTGIMNEFKKGALKLATKPQVPIIPLSINGSRDAYETRGVLGTAKIKLLIHPPVSTKNLSREEEKALTDKVFHIVSQGLEDLKSNNLYT